MSVIVVLMIGYSKQQQSFELEEAKANKVQLVHDYSQALYDFLWDKLPQLTAKDCIAFDLVPYGVWRKFSCKYELILDKIKELHLK